MLSSRVSSQASLLAAERTPDLAEAALGLLMARAELHHGDVETAPTGPDARNAASAISTRLPLLGPDDEEVLLAEAGFTQTRLFYAGVAFRGWVALA